MRRLNRPADRAPSRASSCGLRAEGQYLEAQGETEEIGKQEALEALIQEIVDGAQSTW